jgi:hypothetical protein
MLVSTLRRVSALSAYAMFCGTLCAQPAAGNATRSAVAKDGSGSGNGSWIGFMFGNNQASGPSSAIAAGSWNSATAQGAFVGAGSSNSANGTSSLVIGGFDNHATAIDSLVGAGAGNRATGARSVIVGGGYNLASGPWSFIGGGGRESGSGLAGTTAQDHVAAGKWSVIGGGMGNRAGSSTAQTGATVIGGERNQATNTDATVAGGTFNVASGPYSGIGGGQHNTASGSGAFVGGGANNTASGVAATVPGGSANVASGDYSFAAGQRAKANHAGSFVFADTSAFDFTASANNEFAVRATGGVRLVTAIDGTGAPMAGVTLAAGGGSWTSLSDRAAKKDLVEVDGRTILASLASMPIYTWRYKAEVSGALHMGPTAQDFRAAFGLGDSERTITTVDSEGVALAAAKALHEQLQRQNAVLQAQSREFDALERRLAALESSDAAAVAVRPAPWRLMQTSAAGTTRLRSDMH